MFRGTAMLLKSSRVMLKSTYLRMKEFSLQLNFSQATKTRLYREQKTLTEAIETSGQLSALQLTSLRAALTEAIEEVADDPKFLQSLLDDIHPNLIHLTSLGEDSLLNLPWHVIAEGNSNLLVSKGLPLKHTADGLPLLPFFQPDLPLPLKILVMVAAPDQSDGAVRLDHEAEEKIILDALSDLIRTGEVEVEFIDGDLLSLERALSENCFHVLYFSGHSAFGSRNPGDEPEAMLLLEDESSTHPCPVLAEDFAEVLSAAPKPPPALVLLASCQSGVGSAEKGFRGVAHRLMQVGIPAVIGMGWSITDMWATQFAGAFFKNWQITDR